MSIVKDFVFLNIYNCQHIYLQDFTLFLDFHKIGGFDLFPQLLSDEEDEIRWQTLELIACLVQNNPYCQKAVLENNMLPVLLELLDQDNNSTVKIKALYATSCEYNSPVNISLYTCIYIFFFHVKCCYSFFFYLEHVRREITNYSQTGYCVLYTVDIFFLENNWRLSAH